MKSTYKIALSGLLIAIGVLSGSLFYIPVGVIKAFPIQHVINVLSAVLLGPFYAIGNALVISILRNIMGTGSILAFPGSLIGAALASLFYLKKPHVSFAFVGELLGTGVIGAIVATFMARLFLGSSAGLSVFFGAFFLSSLIGASIAMVLYGILQKVGVLNVYTTLKS